MKIQTKKVTRTMFTVTDDRGGSIEIDDVGLMIETLAATLETEDLANALQTLRLEADTRKLNTLRRFEEEAEARDRRNNSPA